ncbi:MAG TPA: choice-of-anchor D domain-containing protein [Terriglobales bacterium]|nr:choice-of-anchor D domain-containing protein [Terriglobales bacterium]
MKSLTLVCTCLFLCSGIVAAQSNPVPFISQPLVPESVAPGSGAFALTVIGGGFAPTASVRWNGALRPTIVLSSTKLQAKIRAIDVATAQTARVAVVNLDAEDETSDITFFPVRTPAPGLALASDRDFPAIGGAIPGDFNNDGKLDVVNVYASSSTTLEADVYLGKGNGQFQHPIKTRFTNYDKLSVGSVVTGDFNGDHHLDLVVMINESELITLLGDGTGRFTLGPGLRTGSLPVNQESTLAYPFGEDIDGDGNLDLIIATSFLNQTTTAVLFGNGDGSFTDGVHVDNCRGAVVVGDFNEDGLLDLACGYSYQGEIVVILNKGNRTFKLPVSYHVSPVADGLATADLNGDGHLDLVTDTAAVLLGKGDGTFTYGQTGGETSGYTVLTGDFNGDGKLDLVIPSLNESVAVLLGNGDGTFQSAITTAYGFTGGYGGHFTYVDGFTDDGRLNLLGPPSLLLQVPAGLSPGLMDFGSQGVGSQSMPQTATLVDVNSNPLAGIQITVTGTDAQDFSQQNNCPSTLPVGGSCEIQVVFAPTSVGYDSASLSVAYKGNGSPQSIPLLGSGVQLTSVSLLPSSLTFATQDLKTTSTPQVATLLNNGSTDVTISKISTSKQFGQSNNCPATLPVGQSCQIQVTFSPTTVGKANGKLSVTDNAPGSPQTVALSGLGTLITLSPIGINFGNQKVGTSSSPVPVTLSNQGTITLNISQIEIGGANPGDFSQTNNCGSTLAAGAQCTIRVTFTPTQTGARSANVQVQDNVNPSPQDVALGGTGT